MKLTKEAQALLNEKKEIAYKEINEIFNEDDEATYLIVFFNYLLLQKYMAQYIKKNPQSLIIEESDRIIDEYEDPEDLIKIVMNAFIEYGEVMQGMMISYNFKDRSHDEFAYMSIEELEKEKILLKSRLAR